VERYRAYKYTLLFYIVWCDINRKYSLKMNAIVERECVSELQELAELEAKIEGLFRDKEIHNERKSDQGDRSSKPPQEAWDAKHKRTEEKDENVKLKGVKEGLAYGHICLRDIFICTMRSGNPHHGIPEMRWDNWVKRKDWRIQDKKRDAYLPRFVRENLRRQRKERKRERREALKERKRMNVAFEELVVLDKRVELKGVKQGLCYMQSVLRDREFRENEEQEHARREQDRKKREHWVKLSVTNAKINMLNIAHLQQRNAKRIEKNKKANKKERYQQTPNPVVNTFYYATVNNIYYDDPSRYDITNPTLGQMMRFPYDVLRPSKNRKQAKQEKYMW